MVLGVRLSIFVHAASPSAYTNHVLYIYHTPTTTTTPFHPPPTNKNPPHTHLPLPPTHTQLKAEREAAEQVANREEAFRQLLLEQDVRLLAAGSWVAVRGRVADDARFRGVDMDRRRKEIYLDVVDAIKDHAAVQAALSEAQVQRDLTDAMLRGVDRKPRSGRVAWSAHGGVGEESGDVEVRVGRGIQWKGW